MFNIVAGVLSLGLAILAMVMTGIQLRVKQDQDWLSACAVMIGVIHIFEIPIVLFCCIPRARGKVDYLNL